MHRHRRFTYFVADNFGLTEVLYNIAIWVQFQKSSSSKNTFTSFRNTQVFHKVEQMPDTNRLEGLLCVFFFAEHERPTPKKKKPANRDNTWVELFSWHNDDREYNATQKPTTYYLFVVVLVIVVVVVVIIVLLLFNKMRPSLNGTALTFNIFFFTPILSQLFPTLLSQSAKPMAASSRSLYFYSSRCLALSLAHSYRKVNLLFLGSRFIAGKKSFLEDGFIR